jgi:diketogulonate reductase-like aldo/keto reductase
MALEAGFRKFDTAEADWWYDQKSVGLALADFYGNSMLLDDECVPGDNQPTCMGSPKPCDFDELRISTKIPPWSLTSVDDIRANARASRQELVGFCDTEDDGVFPLDVYYIHAPSCWKGWHPRCDNPPPSLLNIYDSWRAMEAVAGIDGSAKRIGLSNVQPDELNAIIQYVNDRKQRGELEPPPRIPDVLQAFADPLQPAEELRRICTEHDIEFVSYSTLGTQHRGGKNPVLTHPTIVGLAAKHQRSVAEVVLSWALQNNMSVIPRSGNPKHIQELARLLADDPTFLSDQDLQAVDMMKHASA